VSRAQQIILFTAASIILAVLLFPPWLGVHWTIDGDSGGGHSKGYHFLFLPPSSSHVNISLLVIQIVAVLLIAGLLFLAAKPKDSN
jgi:hypothetical protein